MKTLITLTFLLLLSFSAFPQIVNTEKLRPSFSQRELQLEASLNLGAGSNKAGQTLRYGFRTRADWNRNRQKWLFFGGADLTQFTSRSEGATPVNFTNRQYAHLRYNFDISPLITLEAFSQYQFNQIQLIKNRSLTGAGSRFRIIEKDSIHIYTGLIYMYEYEEEFKNTSDPKPTEIDLINRDHRLSTYLSIAVIFRDYVTINHVTYYQPRIDQWNDFRISSETELDVYINSYISLKTYFQYIYDSRPPDPVVPRTMYNITTGLGITI